MLHRLSMKYYWLGMTRCVKEFTEVCVLCNQRKRSHVNPIYPLKPIECVRPFSRISKGNRYLIGFQCSFTKYAVAVPVGNKEATTIAKVFVEHVILKLGVPAVLLWR